jgi:O-antigen/teichoic acid export membrane protein
MWGAVSSVICNFILIPKFGIIGAAISVVISFAIMAVSRIVYSWHYVKIKYNKVYVLMLLISVMMIFIIFFVQTDWLKYFLMSLLCIVFVWINYDLKEDVLRMYREIKLRC